MVFSIKSIFFNDLNVQWGIHSSACHQLMFTLITRWIISVVQKSGLELQRIAGAYKLSCFQLWGGVVLNCVCLYSHSLFLLYFKIANFILVSEITIGYLYRAIKTFLYLWNVCVYIPLIVFYKDHENVSRCLTASVYVCVFLCFLANHSGFIISLFRIRLKLIIKAINMLVSWRL